MGRTARKTARGRATDERLLAAAEAVFGRKGFHDASIYEITSAAGIGQGTFYFYYPGKRELLRALIMDLSRQLREATSAATAVAKNRLEAERLALEAFFQFAGKHRNLYRLLHTSAWVDPSIAREYYESFVGAYSFVLKRAQDHGELRPLDPETAAYCLIGVAEALHMRWVEWEGVAPSEAVMEAAMSFISHGLSPAQAEAVPHRTKRGGPT